VSLCCKPAQAPGAAFEQVQAIETAGPAKKKRLIHRSLLRVILNILQLFARHCETEREKKKVQPLTRRPDFKSRLGTAERACTERGECVTRVAEWAVPSSDQFSGVLTPKASTALLPTDRLKPSSIV
jgi:hypothetical protein